MKKVQNTGKIVLTYYYRIHEILKRKKVGKQKIP